MSLIVQKFGGSSLFGQERLLRAAHIIKDACTAGNDVVAVVSAQGNTTDELLRKAGEVLPEPAPRELDALLATGEQASAALMAMALQSIGVPAVSLCAWQLPLLTDSDHLNAAVEGVGTERLLSELAAHRAVVVAGFQGLDERGDVTTLGRGGSDLSAVALAAALRADLLQIYTDVDGIYTTDPRLYSHARRLERVGYDDMLLLARSGAQVLHDRSVALAKKYGVVIELLSCETGSERSLVCADAPDCPVVGITKKETDRSRLCAVTAVGSALPDIRLECRGVTALEERGITVCAMSEGARCAAFYVLRKEGDAAVCALHEALLPGE